MFMPQQQAMIGQGVAMQLPPFGQGAVMQLPPQSNRQMCCSCCPCFGNGRKRRSLFRKLAKSM